jgi:hypothetical protein
MSPSSAIWQLSHRAWAERLLRYCNRCDILFTTPTRYCCIHTCSEVMKLTLEPLLRGEFGPGGGGASKILQQVRCPCLCDMGHEVRPPALLHRRPAFASREVQSDTVQISMPKLLRPFIRASGCTLHMRLSQTNMSIRHCQNQVNPLSQCLGHGASCAD